MWPNAGSSRPSCADRRRGVAAADDAQALSSPPRPRRRPECRPRTAPPRTRPSDRSRTRCGRRPAPRRTPRRCPGRCPDPSGRPGSRRPTTTWVFASSLISVGDHDVGRQHDLAAGVGQQPAAGLDLVGLEQRVADLVALRGQEGEAHPTADEQPVDLRQQRVDHGQLVADLAAAEHDDVGPLRVAGQPVAARPARHAPGRRSSAAAGSPRRRPRRACDAPRRTRPRRTRRRRPRRR